MTEMTRITIPDIGDFDEVEVIEVLVGVGDPVAVEDPVITLESDKATMEIPSPVGGIVASIEVSIGDRVREGALVAEIIEPVEHGPGDSSKKSAEKMAGMEPRLHGNGEDGEREDDSSGLSDVDEAAEKIAGGDEGADSRSPSGAGDRLRGNGGISLPLPPHASPGIRRFARELGADLSLIAGSGPKGRILKEDVKSWVKRQLAKSRSIDRQEEVGIPAVPEIDFSEFGDFETVRLSRIRKLSGPHLQRAWLNIPHVTHHDEADITELEAFRQSLKAEASMKGLRVTLLSFAVKALTGALKEYPNFNASLAPGGEQLILKRYFNVGIAVDTPDGLVVPVIRDVDRKSIFNLARELADLSERARNNRLRPDDLKGGCISISSLGGIGGVAFTPIVNAPEVAILGISRARTMPVWDGQDFVPRLLLPLSLSYDHRVVDGAEAARFVSCLTRLFADVRRLSL